MFVLDNEDYLPSHACFSAATDWEKWNDGSIAKNRFLDVKWHHELWDRYLDRNTKLKQWRDHHRGQSHAFGLETKFAESFKEWNWAYGWNAQGEGWGWERQLGTVPTQQNPDELSLSGEINWMQETVRYLPSKESEIKAPSDMFIIADRSSWREYEDGNVDVFVASAQVTKSFGNLSRRHGKKSNITFMDGHAESLRAEQTLGKTREVARRWNRTNEGIQMEYCVPPRWKPVFLDEAPAP